MCEICDKPCTKYFTWGYISFLRGLAGMHEDIMQVCVTDIQAMNYPGNRICLTDKNLT